MNRPVLLYRWSLVNLRFLTLSSSSVTLISITFSILSRSTWMILLVSLSCRTLSATLSLRATTCRRGCDVVMCWRQSQSLLASRHCSVHHVIVGLKSFWLLLLLPNNNINKHNTHKLLSILGSFTPQVLFFTVEFSISFCF